MKYLHSSWKKHLAPVFETESLKSLKLFLQRERQQKHIFYPPSSLVFNALNLTPLETLKVVIVGQDPYHGKGQAHGLSFSVQKGEKIPPSLKNIEKELSNDLNIPPCSHGDLSSWAKQGILLLNTVLTVRAGAAASHQKQGWETLTESILHLTHEKRERLVFILWGAHARKFASFIDKKRHLVLESAHPSPLSAYNGFFGSKPFSKTNDYLISHQKEPIQWERV